MRITEDYGLTASKLEHDLLLPGYKFDVDPEVRSRQMSLLDTPEYAMKYLKGSLEDEN